MRKLVIVLILLALTSPTYAVLPVIDGAAIAKMIQQINQLKSQYSLLQNQYHTAENQLQSLTGQRGWGGFSNSATQISNQFGYAPNSYSQAMSGQGGSADYQKNKNDYVANHHVITEQEYEQGTTPENASNYKERTQTTQVTAVTATTAFDTIQNNLKEVEKLAAEIDSTKNNDVKSAIDLQTRVNAQLAYIQIQEVQLQATLNNEMSATHARDQLLETQRAEDNALDNNIGQ